MFAVAELEVAEQNVSGKRSAACRQSRFFHWRFGVHYLVDSAHGNQRPLHSIHYPANVRYGPN